MEYRKLRAGPVGFLAAAVIFAAAAVAYMWDRKPADTFLPRCDDQLAQAEAAPHARCQDNWK